MNSETANILLELRMILTGAHDVDHVTTAEERAELALKRIDELFQPTKEIS